MSEFDRKRDPNCQRCNYDIHRCPGCGDPLPHGSEVCRSCCAEHGLRFTEELSE